MRIKSRTLHSWPYRHEQPATGRDLVDIALYNEASTQDQLNKLREIVGNIIDSFPEDARIALCGLEYDLVHVPERNIIG